MSGACASNVSRCTGHAGGRLDVERRRLRGKAHGQVAGAHGLEGLAATRPAPTRFAASGWASPPSTGTAVGAPASRGSTVMRTVVGLSDDTAISTGLPPIVIAVACPRMMPPDSATPAPAAAICLSASRRVVD